MLCLLAWTRSDGASRPAWWRMVLLVVGASLVTHPLAWWSNRGLADVLAFETRAAIIEAAVVVVEAILLRGGLLVRWPAALSTALVMNMASFGFGLWLQSRR